jgi:hypothetical protein
MSARLLAVAAAVAVLSAVAPPARAADPPKELLLVPADSMMFFHVNVAALYDGLLADVLKGMKAEDAKAMTDNLAKSFGFDPAEVSTYTYAMPSMDGPDASFAAVSVITFRKPIDAKAKLAEMKKAKEKGGEVTEKGGVLTLVAPHPYDPKKRLTTITDLSDPQRLVTVTGVGAEPVQPTDGKGVHADVFAKHDGAVLLAGMNLGKLPAELKMADLPPDLAPFKSILLAERAGLAGTLVKDKLTMTLSVVSKDKENAAGVSKAFEAGRKLIAGGLADARKQSAADSDAPKGLGAAFDALDAAVKDGTITTEGSTVTGSASLNKPGALMGPMVEQVRRAAERMTVANNLKQLCLAMHNYDAAFATLPPAYTTDPKGKKLHSWRVAILPFIEEDDLYKKFKLDEPWDSEHNLKVVKDNPMPKVFAMPGSTDLDDKKTHFQVFVGNGAAFDGGKGIRITDMSDGTSNTLMVVTAAKAVEWTKPDDIEFDPKKDVKEKLLVKHGRIAVGMGDGSVRTLSPKIKEETLKAVVTRSGGEVVSLDDE